MLINKTYLILKGLCLKIEGYAKSQWTENEQRRNSANTQPANNGIYDHAKVA